MRPVKSPYDSSQEYQLSDVSLHFVFDIVARHASFVDLSQIMH